MPSLSLLPQHPISTLCYLCVTGAAPSLPLVISLCIKKTFPFDVRAKVKPLLKSMANTYWARNSTDTPTRVSLNIACALTFYGDGHTWCSANGRHLNKATKADAGKPVFHDSSTFCHQQPFIEQFLTFIFSCSYRWLVDNKKCSFMSAYWSIRAKSFSKLLV